ncbi:hypothetical protein N2152v2_001060 [Parachlorella kessleri]
MASRPGSGYHHSRSFTAAVGPGSYGAASDYAWGTHRRSETSPAATMASCDPQAWALAEDVFEERYQPALAHTDGSWQPITQLALTLDSSAAAGSPVSRQLAFMLGTSAAPGSRLWGVASMDAAQQGQQLRPRPLPAATPGGRPVSAAAALLLQQHDPWQGALGGVDAARPAGRSDRPRLLFQYKPYCQQEPLNLSETEVAAVLEAVFGPMEGSGSPPVLQGLGGSLWDTSAALGGAGAGATTGEVAAVVLVKLIMDLYIKGGPKAAFPLALMLLQKPLVRGHPAAKARCFHLLYNLSIHGELLYPSAADSSASDPGVLLEAEVLPPEANEPNFDWRATVNSAFRRQMNATMRSSIGKTTRRAGGLRGMTNAGPGPGEGPPGSPMRLDGMAEEEGASASAWPPLGGRRPPQADPRAERFQQWLRLLLFRLLAVLCSLDAATEGAWAAALSCLVHLASYEGRVVRSYVDEMPLSVVAALLQRSRQYRWSEQLHAWLIQLAANLLYSHPAEDASGRRSTKTPSVSESLGRAGAAAAGGGREGGGHRRSASFGGSYKSGAGGGGGGGGGGCQEGGGPWWALARLDPGRLHDFGGMRQVLQCYREGPTARCRQCMFSVIYDYVTDGQHQGGDGDSSAPVIPHQAHPSKPAHHGGDGDSSAPVIPHQAHPSEVAALGAALLRVRASEALHPLFLAGARGLVQRLADELVTQMAANQVDNPGKVISVPTALVNEVMSCFEDMAASWVEVPQPLDEVFQHSLEMVTTPAGASSASLQQRSPASDAMVWDSLLDLLKDSSPLGRRVGQGWLTRLLMAAAEAALQSSGGGSGLGMAAPEALLPEVAPYGCQLNPGKRGIRGQERLRDLLERLLATADVDNRATAGLMVAVTGLLAGVRLRCRQAWLEAEEQGLVRPGLVPSRTTSQETSGGGSGYRTPDRQQARQASVPRPSDGEDDAASTGALGATPGERTAGAQAGSVSGGNGSPLEDAARVWQDLDCAAAILSTISLAVEWLRQAPLDARQSGMLQAARLLLTFLLQQHPPPHSAALLGLTSDPGLAAFAAAAGNGTSGREGASAGAAAGLSRGGSSAQDLAGGDAGPPQGTPGGAGAAQGQAAGVTPRRGPTPGLSLDIPATPGPAPGTAGGPLPSASTPTPPGTAGGPPSSASQRRGGPSPWSPAAGTAGQPPSLLAATPRPVTSPAAILPSPGGVPGLWERPPPTPQIPGVTHAPRAPQLDVAAATAGAAAAAAEQAVQERQRLWEAMAAAEERGTLLWSLLNGLALVPQDLLALVPPLLLLTLFEDLKPEDSGGVYYPPSTPGQDAAAGRLMRAADAAMGAKATVQTDRALWDARAAMLLLLMGRCMKDEAAMELVGGPSFFAGLLHEGDQRIRHYASIFVLRQLMLSRPQQYRRALRQVILRAQQSNDERLLANPYLQVKAMMDGGLLGPHTSGLAQLP